MTTKVFPKFKEFDVKYVAQRKRLELYVTHQTLDQPFCAFVSLPYELLEAIFLYGGILAKSKLAQLCKKMYFLLDLSLEQKMYEATMSTMRKQDFKFKADLERFYTQSLILRAIAFDDMNYFNAGCGLGSLKVSSNPFTGKGMRSELLLSFNTLLEANAVTIFDYFVKANEKREKNSEDVWKFTNDQDFQSFLWISATSLANSLVVNSVPVQIVSGSIIDRIMLFASKYSYILLRLLLAHQGSLSAVKFPALPSGSSAAKFLSDLLQHKEAYPLDLTGVRPEFQINHNFDYAVPPLELTSHHGHLDAFKVLVQHTPVLPKVGYLAYLGTIQASSSNVSDLIEEFYAHGADVNNATLHRLKRKKISHIFYVDSPLGVAQFASGSRVEPLVLMECCWLVAQNIRTKN